MYKLLALLLLLQAQAQELSTSASISTEQEPVELVVRLSLTLVPSPQYIEEEDCGQQAHILCLDTDVDPNTSWQCWWTGPGWMMSTCGHIENTENLILAPKPLTRE